jgi:hypothetical protein
MEAESIEQAFKANSKEILAHTMGSEIEEMVKESLGGSIGLNEDEDEENVDLELDLDSDEAGLDAGDDLDLDLGDEGDMDMGDLDLELGDEEDMEMDDEDLEVVDLTGEDDETVVSVFKKMAPEDEIEVVQTDGGVEIKDNETGAEYKIELGGGEMEDEDEMDIDFEDEEMEDEDEMELDLDIEDDEDEMEMDDDMNEEIVYEVIIDEDEDEEEVEKDEDEDDPVEEASRTNSSVTSNKVGNRKGSDRNYNRMNVRKESFTPRAMKLIKENKVLKDKMSSISSENETLKEDYNKMVDALREFRQKLNEVAVFNSNLTYAVRLFTENSTTKGEKVDIIKRFDEVKTLKESKNVYKNLVKELSNTKAPIKESIDNKLNETKSSGSATEITESKVYVDPQIEKMKKLWEYQYKN